MSEAGPIASCAQLEPARRAVEPVPGVSESVGAVSPDANRSTPQHGPQPSARSASRAPWRFALRRLARHKGPFALALFWSVVFILVPMQVPVITGALVDGLRAK